MLSRMLEPSRFHSVQEGSMMDRSLEERARPAEYRMIDSFRIKHFRCFQTLDLTALRRINVIVGRNAAGKTALLEGIRLGLGATPNLLWSLNQQRGLVVFFQPNQSREQFEAQWNGYFY